SLRTVAESMAGRVGILELGHMTESEQAGLGDSWQGVLHAWVQSAGASLTIDPSKTLPAQSIFQRMWRGGMPGLIPAPDNLVHPYLASYVQTYLERDVRLSGAFLNIPEFGRFLRLSAALNGQEINLSQLGRELGMQGATARRWLDWLSQSYQWIELPAWSGNTIKRISSRPKGYLSDTGLAAYLLGIQ